MQNWIVSCSREGITQFILCLLQLKAMPLQQRQNRIEALIAIYFYQMPKEVFYCFPQFILSGWIHSGDSTIGSPHETEIY